MRNITLLVRLVLGVGGPLLALSALACANQSNAPPAYASPAPNQGGGVTQTPGYGDGTASPTLAATPVANPAPATSAAPPLSTPNPLALPCTVDAHCLTHRCNVAAQKCAWPCQTDNDCIPGNTCIAPTCLPKLQ
ncbi:MAG TPA: hypothetical protein VER11_05495 [Polyangiaceae bacterium]|nr:hypothetical protein [Polyangiaceae bacterium]